MNKKERGATLIVVLVILVVMTFLGLGSISDTNLQLAMVRNNQLQSSAHAAALTEINAQISAINSNLQTEIDQAVFDLIRTPPDANGFRSIQPDALLDGLLRAEEGQSPYQTNIQLQEPNANATILLPGISLNRISVKPRSLQFQSTATVQGTTATSTQIQGVLYLTAN